MDVLVVGGTGTIGSAVVEAMEKRHEVVAAGHTSGEVQVDLADPASIDDFAQSLSNKLMGQVNLVRRGLDAVREEGVFTLTSGLLSRKPVAGSAAISLVNAGLEGFVRAAALEMPRELRVNVVSPPWVQETLEAMETDYSPSLPANAVAEAYRKSVEGGKSGATIKVWEEGE